MTDEHVLIVHDALSKETISRALTQDELTQLSVFDLTIGQTPAEEPAPEE